MIKDKKQIVEDISDSTIIQIAGDQHIHQFIYNNTEIPTTEELNEISRNVVKYELDIYKNEANKIAEDRFNVIVNKAIDKITRENSNLFLKFKYPAIQVALNETYKKYIETGDEELGENLINMLIDRLEIESTSTLQSIIDDARVIIPKLSVQNIAFLALKVFSMLSIPTNNINEYSIIVEKFKKITNEILTLTNIDLMYLKQLNCAIDKTGILMTSTKSGILDLLLNSYEYYFSKGINTSQFNELLKKHNIRDDIREVLPLSHVRKDDSFILSVSSRARFEDYFEKNDLPKIKLFYEEFISIQNKATYDDVINFHQSIDKNWSDIFSLWNEKNITALSIMPVGLYIGSVYLRRVLDIKIPQEIFYK